MGLGERLGRWPSALTENTLAKNVLICVKDENPPFDSAAQLTDERVGQSEGLKTWAWRTPTGGQTVS
jgi:hypothetical protein